MKNKIKIAQKYSIYLFIFSLNFAQLNFLNLGIDFLVTKITIFLLFAISIINYKSSYSYRDFAKYLNPILLYFAILTILSFINHTSSYQNIFDFPLFTNILTFLLLMNYSKMNPELLLKGLFVFAISTFILSILYFSGIGVSEQLAGRYTVFGINMNILGLSLCISLVTLISIIFENRLKLGRYRFLFLFFIPFLFIFMLITASRVAMISFILGIFVFLYFNKYVSTIKKILIILFTSMLFVMLWIIFLKNSLIVERLFDVVNKGDLSSRDLIWIPLFDLISNNFMFGVGKTGYAMRFAGGSPHNVIIEVLCYTGIIGLLVFLFFFFRIVSNAFKRLKFDNEMLPIILTIPILGMILSGQIFDQKIVWIIFAYIASKKIIEDNTEIQMDNTI